VQVSLEPYFGGPDRPRGYLRDILAERITAVRRGGEIDWVTYYFRDSRLAEELLRAHRRGVKVRLTLEQSPRTEHANHRVLSMLSGPQGLGEGLRAITHEPLAGLTRKPHLHEKLYCFSEPEPVALVGSFNPSGDDPETEPEIIDEILDHDGGHNVLVAMRERHLVAGLVRHARRMHTGGHGIFERCDRTMNQTLRSAETIIHFSPRLGRNPVSRLLAGFGKGTKARFAASHIKGPGATFDFLGLARRGANVEILAESSERRVPGSIEQRLADTGVKLIRFPHRANIPMHNKFALLEDHRGRWTMFGSYNWTTRSRWFNHEISVISRDRDLFDAFAERWETLLDMAAQTPAEA
jgi:phosphatidylserine/phosphatidylglycerophosphate/cardiolipin synthase-like enzyme